MSRVRPRILVSYAQSIDGKIAMLSGQSQWISGAETLNLAHELRGASDVILVGIGTVLRDDPELSCRLPDCSSPVRVVLDSKLRIPTNSRIAETASTYETVVFTGENALAEMPEKRSELESCGIAVEPLPLRDTRISIPALYDRLAELEYRQIFVEGGSAVITSFLHEHLVHRMIVVIAPIIIGEGIPAVSELNIAEMRRALPYTSVRERQMGVDLVWELSCNG